MQKIKGGNTLRLLKKYKHGLIILIYAVIYLKIFGYLEKRTDVDFHIIHTPLDNYIPFCEYFIVPYIFWFVYMLIAILFFIFVNPDRKEYYQMVFSLGTGMTIFLLVSYFYPNGLDLRPAEMVRDNIFTDTVQLLYRHDSPTNVLPSIHVYNSLAIHIAFSKSKMLEKDRWLIGASFILTCLIILSTVFLKQHSLVDVITGIVMAVASYFLFYKSRFIDFIFRKSPNPHFESL